jgi:hypothetical protein
MYMCVHTHLHSTRMHNVILIMCVHTSHVHTQCPNNDYRLINKLEWGDHGMAKCMNVHLFMITTLEGLDPI